MKCPKCEANHRHSGGMTCMCGYRFIFNPKDSSSGDMRDNRLVKTIQRVGRDGSAVYTQNQLYSAYISKGKSSVGLLVSLGITAIVGCVVAVMIDPVIGMVILISAIVVAVLSTVGGRPLKRSRFNLGIQRWLNEGRTLEGMIEEPSLHQPPTEWPESDIYDYGVERILIVQRPILVDLFVKNNQHAEQKMLVVSESGYPEYIRDHANRLLAERTDLPVYLLHDADADGGAMASRVQAIGWLTLHGNPVIDLGFSLSDFKSLKRTKRFRDGVGSSELPVDALRLGSLSLGLSQCFQSQTTFATELLRERENEMRSASSFG